MLLAGTSFLAGPASAQDGQITLPNIQVTQSRLGEGITGSSTTVITAQDIERMPQQTLQDILSAQPGIQVQNLYGSVAGARDTVDIRGFGATSTSNALVLLNGRRLNDIDIAGVDFAAIPRESIERIEIIRGGSGAVLYGDGAVGGVINIITKTGAGLPPSARIEGAVGSYGYREGNISGRATSGPVTAWAYAGAINSDGYRDNNALRERVGIADVRYNTERGSLYLNVSVDDQSIGLPGGRHVTPTTSELVTDRRGAATPFDYGDKQGINLTTGGTLQLRQGVQLIVDGGVRRKAQQAGFFSSFGSAFDSYVDTVLTTYSVTPRVKADYSLFGMSANAIAGVDVYHSIYGSDRDLHRGDPPNHHYDITQTSVGIYGQNTVAILPTTDISFGLRAQNTDVSARDRLDMTAPGGAFATAQGLPFDGNNWAYAYHLGIEHRLTPWATLFARAGRSFRVANVDERIGQSSFGVATNFDLRTQVSRDYEAGVRLHGHGLDWRTSVYLMNLTDELFFSPATFTNINLDPTRRYGVESEASYQVNPVFRIKGGVAYTRAVFREGVFAGNDIPLVSRWSGSAGFSWDIVDKRLVFDALAHFVGTRHMDNDSANTQVLIPAYTTVDVRLGGTINRFKWSVSVENLFDTHYFNYAISSLDFITGLPAYGTYNAYPQPGRTVMARASMTLP
jgi:iron complex outermembrane receptor protein